MEKYIALLRGINVGGKNPVSMPLLKAAFEEAGFTQVSTYINSGNVVFESPEIDAAALQARCRRLIMDAFDLDLPVAVISATQLGEALENAPGWWGQDPESKHNAIFVIAPSRAEDIMAEVGQPKPEYEQVAYYGPVIFWSAPLKTYSRTRWSRIVSSAAYDSVTIRNSNTTRKLLDLAR